VDFYHHHDDGTEHLCNHISGREGERLEIETESYVCSDCGAKIVGKRRGDILNATVEGHELEHRVAHYFRKRGWRAFTIWGKFDIIAIKDGEILLIQCKRSRKKLTPLVRRDTLDEWQYMGYVGHPFLAYVRGSHPREEQNGEECVKLLDLLTEKEYQILRLSKRGSDTERGSTADSSTN
jgi:DNA-directed RNA polymerase subunit RPC12/RpoP